MAEKRMFTQKIIDSDAFLDMPLSTQCLYFHLNMRADDDGFINNPKKIQRMIGCSDDDLKLLIVKRFVIGFESGVIVIKHWRMHNTLRKDRYHPTQYQDELKQLQIKENNAYTEVATKWQPNGNQLVTEYSIDKNSIDKNSIDSGVNIDNTININKSDEKPKRFIPPTLEEVKAYCLERKNDVDPERFINFYQSKGWMVGHNKMKDWKAAVRTWEQKDKRNNNEVQPHKITKFDV